MGLMNDIKYGRKALSIANSLKNKSETDLNNFLYDLRMKYSVSDDDWMSIEAAVALLTQKKIFEQMGIKG